MKFYYSHARNFYCIEVITLSSLREKTRDYEKKKNVIQEEEELLAKLSLLPLNPDSEFYLAFEQGVLEEEKERVESGFQKNLLL